MAETQPQSAPPAAVTRMTDQPEVELLATARAALLCLLSEIENVGGFDDAVATIRTELEVVESHIRRHQNFPQPSVRP